MIKMLVAAKVSPEKFEELQQTMGSIKRDLEISECRMDFILCRKIRQPSNISIIFEWDNELDFECSLDENEFRIICGALKVLCEEFNFCCNSLSPKWSLFTGIPEISH